MSLAAADMPSQPFSRSFLQGAKPSWSRGRFPTPRWLTERIAHYLQLPPAEIDPRVKLRTYGLESIHALSLCVDVEEAIGLLVEPTLAWDYPTIDAIADHLTELLSQGRAVAPPPR
ncbi:acyl carrier protein [Microtetraspora sp. NBRC 16547]|uniref:acyl carrier protein n=1 Tax=Microtetraspora sp. NBRC 16547 TaxID=3030993 RepID=UPI002556F8C9|nr:acyl carrier protein [Microtetraspora sp. NBRC 16547]